MLQNQDALTFGPYDVLVVLQNKHTRRFHAAVFIEAPINEPHDSASQIIRLRSKFHYSMGAANWALAQQQLAALAERFQPPANNVASEPLVWDGEWPFVILTGNWVAQGVNVSEMIHHPR